MLPFDNFDLSKFWEKSDYANREYVDATPTAETLAAVESALGYRLPAAYVALASYQNGGIPLRTVHRAAAPSSWAIDHVALTGIYSIGHDKPNSLCGAFGSKFWIDEWQYPEIGVYFADCPSAGHDMLCLDYRACGPTGEPTVVHVDQEGGCRITFVAPNFEAFIRSLEDGDAFDFD